MVGLPHEQSLNKPSMSAGKLAPVYVFSQHLLLTESTLRTDNITFIRTQIKYKVF